jgi:hypothetical protein
MTMGNLNGKPTKNKSVESVKLNKILEDCIFSADVILKFKNKRSSVKLHFKMKNKRCSVDQRISGQGKFQWTT